MTEHQLVVDDVVKSFGGLRAVDHASFGIRPASITALIGPNGAGKTSLFNIVAGFLRADAGTISYGGRNVSGMPPHAIASRGLVRTFQITRTMAFMSVLDNMMVAAPAHPGEQLVTLVTRPLSVRRRERTIRRRAVELLELLGLAGSAEQDAGTLSGGQRKLLEVGRALMTEPTMLLLDEPMAGVNRTLGRELLELIERLRTERGMTFLFVEHDMDVVMDYADRVIVMSDGRVLFDGLPRDVRTDERVVDAYLGTPILG